MKITEQQLRQLIRVGLKDRLRKNGKHSVLNLGPLARHAQLPMGKMLTELFDSPSYPFSVVEMNVVTAAQAEGSPGRFTQQDVLYEFTTDPTEEEQGLIKDGGYSYVVSFTLEMLDGSPARPDEDMKDPENYFWSIIFEAKEIGNPNSDYDVTQTNQSDMRVFSTIAAIVENFVVEVLPEIPDNDIKTFSFVGSPTHVFDDQEHTVVTARGDDGQTRRTRVYLTLLKKKLPVGSKILPVPPGGLHSAGEEENIIFFKVP